MAKSSRASSKKLNNQRKAAAIFGPAESARAERLSARLLEAARQHKPESSDVNMDEQDEDATVSDQKKAAGQTAMDVDPAKPSKGRISKNRVDKRRQKKTTHVFENYSDRKVKKGSK